MRLLIGTLLSLAIHVGTAEATPKMFCELYDLPISMADIQGLRFRDAAFGSGTDHSGAAVTVVNESGKPLTLISMLAEFVDQKGRNIITIPLVGGLVSLITDGQTGLPIRSQWREPVGTGENVTLANPVPYVTRQCPSRVTLIPIVVGFADGTRSRYIAKDFSLLPIILTPRGFDLRTLKRPRPFEARLRVEVDSTGKVKAVSVIDKSDADLESWAALQLGGWEFRPAMRDGLAVDSEVFLLLRLHKSLGRVSDLPETTVAAQEKVEIPVDIYPKPGEPPENQLIWIGQFMYAFPERTPVP